MSAGSLPADFPFRPGAHHLLTFSMMYCFNENFVLALSHDEVVHGKCSLIGRMPGDYWRQFAGLRVLALYQAAHPGAKHNFMGSEIAQFIEWRYYEGLEWFLLDYDTHRRHQDYIRALNRFYREDYAVLSAGEVKLYDDGGNTGLLSYSASSAALTYSLSLDEGERTVTWYMTCSDGEMQEARLLLR